MSLPENVKCPECGGPMVSRTGQYGVFWGCKAYPNCKGTRDSMGRSKADREEWKSKQIEKDDNSELTAKERAKKWEVK
jgi:ssDNA-binding Zn-finger/Zn-ribbon topoisomerase 1